jgi:hypothetical protein
MPTNEVRRGLAAHAAAIALLLYGLMAGPFTSEVHAMPSSREQASHLLDLPPSEYFDLGEDHILALQSALAKAADGGPGFAPAASAATLLALGAPRVVDPLRASKLPVLVGSVQSGLRAWRVNFQTNLWLLLRNLTTGDLVVVTPFNAMRRGDAPLLSGVGTPPDPVVANSLTSAVEVIDLLARLGHSPAPGRYLVTAIAHDLRSNSVGIQVLGAAPKDVTTSQPAPLTFAQKSERLTRSLVDLPTHAGAQSQMMMRAALQIEAHGDARVEDAALASWPCNVVLVKLDQAPLVRTVFVKLERAAVTGDVQRFNAAFALDLSTAMPERLMGSYQVYVDAGSEVLGPYPLEIGN